jgi:hypothetical protein
MNHRSSSRLAPALRPAVALALLGSGLATSIALADPVSAAPIPHAPSPAASRAVKPSTMRLTVTDPQSGYNFQVGDALTMRAVIRDPNRSKPSGTVSFSSDNSYDKCKTVTLRRETTATCYLTFYSPGRFYVTAKYTGLDHSDAKITIHFSVVPSAND